MLSWQLATNPKPEVITCFISLQANSWWVEFEVYIRSFYKAYIRTMPFNFLVDNMKAKWVWDETYRKYKVQLVYQDALVRVKIHIYLNKSPTPWNSWIQPLCTKKVNISILRNIVRSIYLQPICFQKLYGLARLEHECHLLNYNVTLRTTKQ